MSRRTVRRLLCAALAFGLVAPAGFAPGTAQLITFFG